QFNRDQLAEALPAAGIAYEHREALGGRRRTSPDSPNGAWRNESFRGYADYMLTDAFQQQLDELIDLARHDRPAVMCAEAVPWRCHRWRTADALPVRGVKVEHIMTASQRPPHKLRAIAQPVGNKVMYPPVNLFTPDPRENAEP